MFFLVSIFSIEVEEEEDWMPRITQGELLSMAFPEMKESFLLQENIGGFLLFFLSFPLFFSLFFSFFFLSPGKGRPISKEEMKQYTKLLYEQGMEIIDSFHSPIETEKSLLLKKERGAEEDNCVYVPMVLDITFLTSGAGYLSGNVYFLFFYFFIFLFFYFLFFYFFIFLFFYFFIFLFFYFFIFLFFIFYFFLFF